MNGKTLGIAFLAALAGAVAGFVLANSLNRSELNSLKSRLDKGGDQTAATSKKPDELTLDPEELKAKIAEADASPENFQFQQQLGSALYRYAAMKKDTQLLEESVRILSRANQLDPKNYGVIVDLGNGLFDIGYFKKDAESMRRSREFYQKALAIKPDDADVHADYALSFFLAEPADLDRAISEFQKALKSNPKQERAMQYLAQTYIRKSDFASAQKIADQLRAANPNNDSLPLLLSQIEKREAAPIQ